MQISSSLLTAALVTDVAETASLSISAWLALAAGLTAVAGVTAAAVTARLRRRLVPVKVRKQ